MGGMDMNSAEKRAQSNPDPIVQERDYPDKYRKGKQSPDIILSPEKAKTVHNVTAWPNSFMGAGHGAPAVPTANNLISSMLRYKWTIIIIFILVSAPAVALVWTQIIPKYRARAELRIRPSIPRLVFRTDENGAIPFYDSFVNTQVSIIRSPTVLNHVLEHPDVNDTQWLNNPRQSLIQRLRGDTLPPLERLRDALSVRPRRRTEIIDIDFIDPNPSDAKVIVNTVLDQYQKYISIKSDEDDQKLTRQLTEEYNSLKQEIQGKESIITALKESIQTANPQELITSKKILLEETKARLFEIQRTIDLLKRKQKRLAKDPNDMTLTANAHRQSRYEEDAEWQKRDIDVRTLEHQIANSGLTSNHSNRVRMQKDLEFAKELRQLREAQLDEVWSLQSQDVSGSPEMVAQWRDQSINVIGDPITVSHTNTPVVAEGSTSLEFELEQSEKDKEVLEEYYKSQQNELTELFKTAQMLDNENNDLKHTRELFEAVQERLTQKEMEQKAQEAIATIQVLTPAFAPSEPYSDRRVVFTAMALVMSLGMGGGVAFLRASRNQTVYTLKDMPYPLQVPLLGHVPVAQAKRTQKKAIRKSSYAGEKYESGHVESIRLVRTTLLARMECGDKAAVLITSASPGTGKSHFAMTLGESFARAGKKVLLIDADLRKRTLTQRSNLAEKPGFVESLCSKSADKRHIFPTETVGLSIMPAGRWNDNEAFFEQTANGVFKACIAQLRKDYDIILLDSPPIMPVADATILSSQVDGTIMVERELVSHREDLNDALTRLISSGGRLLGTVFVGSQDRKEYGYKYAYGQA